MPRSTAKDVVVQLIREAPQGVWTGKTKLFKAFYFAHLYHAERNTSLLTDWPIARMPEGPGIDKSGSIFGDLVQAGVINIELIREGPYPEYRYRLTEKGLSWPALPSDAESSVHEAAEFTLPRTAAELSAFTHEHSRSWKQGVDGQVLDIYIDLIAEEEFEAGMQRVLEFDGILQAVMRNAGYDAQCAAVP